MSAAADGVAPGDANAGGAAGPARPGTAIAPRAPEPRDDSARRRAHRGGLVSYVSRWRPLRTPRLTLTLLLYLFGLFVAFGARPPVTVSDAAQERFWREMEAADAFDAAPRLGLSATWRARRRRRAARTARCASRARVVARTSRDCERASARFSTSRSVIVSAHATRARREEKTRPVERARRRGGRRFSNARTSRGRCTRLGRVTTTRSGSS